MGPEGRAASAGNEPDLRGVRRPLSWAKTKVRLETLRAGEQLTVWLIPCRVLTTARRTVPRIQRIARVPSGPG